MTLEQFLQSVQNDPNPPSELSGPLKALWLAKNDQWDASHDVVNDIDTSMGSWIHAHLHLIEGDLGNAAYWYRRAGKPVGSPEMIDAEWHEIVRSNFES